MYNNIVYLSSFQTDIVLLGPSKDDYLAVRGGKRDSVGLVGQRGCHQTSGGVAGRLQMTEWPTRHSVDDGHSIVINDASVPGPCLTC